MVGGCRWSCSLASVIRWLHSWGSCFMDVCWLVGHVYKGDDFLQSLACDLDRVNFINHFMFFERWES